VKGGGKGISIRKKKNGVAGVGRGLSVKKQNGWGDLPDGNFFHEGRVIRGAGKAAVNRGGGKKGQAGICPKIKKKSPLWGGETNLKNTSGKGSERRTEMLVDRTRGVRRIGEKKTCEREEQPRWGIEDSEEGRKRIQRKNRRGRQGKT